MQKTCKGGIDTESIRTLNFYQYPSLVLVCKNVSYKSAVWNYSVCCAACKINRGPCFHESVYLYLETNCEYVSVDLQFSSAYVCTSSLHLCSTFYFQPQTENVWAQLCFSVHVWPKYAGGVKAKRSTVPPPLPPAATQAGSAPSKWDCLCQRAETCRPNSVSERRNGSLKWKQMPLINSAILVLRGRCSQTAD